MDLTKELTKRQQEIFDFIKRYSSDHGYPPTVREIGKRFGIGNPNGVVCHLKALVRKGRIKRVAGISRGILVVN